MKRSIVLFLIFLAGCSTFRIPEATKAPVEISERENALIEEGITLHDEGKYDEAIQKYQEARIINPGNILALYEEAYSNYAKQDYKRSLDLCKKGMEYHSELLMDFYIIAANSLDDLGENEESLALYEKAIWLAPDNNFTYYNYAIALYRAGKTKEAEENLMKSIQLNPEHASSHLYLMRLMMDEGKQIQALMMVSRFLIIEPNTSRTPEALGDLENLLYYGVEKEGDNFNLNVFLNDGHGVEFSNLELTLKLQHAVIAADSVKTTEIQNRVRLFSTMFSVIEKKEKDKLSDIGKYLLPYFDEMEENGHTEAFVYYIHQLVDMDEIQNYLKDNEAKINAFLEWNSKYYWE